MGDEALKDEVQTLRDQVARLEAERATPVPVRVEGFEGLRQLSRAIETKNLDAFLVDRSVPDRVFWLGLIGVPIDFFLIFFVFMK